jgi:hypothetical protein
MARDGSGNYAIPNTFTAGTVIASASVNANFSDIATALTNSLARNGEGPMSAVLPLDATGFVYSVDPDSGIKRTAANEQAIFVGGGNVVVVGTATVSISAAINLTGPLVAASVSGQLGTFTGTITVTGSSAGFVGNELISTEAGAAAGPILSLFRDSASPAASDFLAKINWYGRDSGANKIVYGLEEFQITDASNGSADANWIIQAVIGGALTDIIRSSATQIQIPGSLAVTGAVTGASQTVTGDQSAATASGSQIATQSDQETSTATNKLVTPAVQQFHPSAAKCWGKFDNAASFSASYNVTSGTDNGTGDWTVTIATDFSTANYGAVFGVEFGNTTQANGAGVRNGGQAAGTLRVAAWFANNAGNVGVPSDDNGTHVAMFGDQ